MHSYADKKDKTNRDTITPASNPKRSNGESNPHFIDNRAETISQLQQHTVTNNSSRVQTTAQLQEIAQDRSRSFNPSQKSTAPSSHTIQLQGNGEYSDEAEKTIENQHDHKVDIDIAGLQTKIQKIKDQKSFGFQAGLLTKGIKKLEELEKTLSKLKIDHLAVLKQQVFNYRIGKTDVAAKLQVDYEEMRKEKLRMRDNFNAIESELTNHLKNKATRDKGGNDVQYQSDKLRTQKNLEKLGVKI
jgi:hypothetical protein